MHLENTFKEKCYTYVSLTVPKMSFYKIHRPKKVFFQVKLQPKSFFQIVDCIELEPLSGFCFIAIYALVEVVSIYLLLPRQSE